MLEIKFPKNVVQKRKYDIKNQNFSLNDHLDCNAGIFYRLIIIIGNLQFWFNIKIEKYTTLQLCKNTGLPTQKKNNSIGYFSIPSG